ncbi:hypothetical protein [Gottfriedia acidiceleris]|nr:hypothetical protein [Gottfriedia acidiceleris]
MILKERSIPLTIKKLEALLKRIPVDYNQRVKIEEDSQSLRLDIKVKSL